MEVPYSVGYLKLFIRARSCQDNALILTNTKRAFFLIIGVTSSRTGLQNLQLLHTQLYSILWPPRAHISICTHNMFIFFAKLE